MGISSRVARITAAILGVVALGFGSYWLGGVSHHIGRLLPPRSPEAAVIQFFNAAWDLDFEDAWHYVATTQYNPEDDPRRHFQLNPECSHSSEDLRITETQPQRWTVQVQQKCPFSADRSTTLTVTDTDAGYRLLLP